MGTACFDSLLALSSTDGGTQPGPVPKSLQKQRRVLERLVSSECEYGPLSCTCDPLGRAVTPTTPGTRPLLVADSRPGAPRVVEAWWVFSPVCLGLAVFWAVGLEPAQREHTVGGKRDPVQRAVNTVLQDGAGVVRECVRVLSRSARVRKQPLKRKGGEPHTKAQ